MSFTDKQIDALKAPLGSSHVKGRKQGGREVSYIEGWHAIAEANRIFGFDSWDRETVEIRHISESPRKIGKPPYEKDGWGVAYMAKVIIRVRTVDGVVVRWGCGFGSGIDADLGAAHESALKEAETDAMKRALMTFGNPFGLALYDKTQANVVDDRKPETKLNAATDIHPDDRRSAAEDWTERALKRIAEAPTSTAIMAWHDKPNVNAFLRKMRDDENMADLFAVIQQKMQEALATKPKE